MATPMPAESNVCSSGAGTNYDAAGSSVFCRGSKEILVASVNSGSSDVWQQDPRTVSHGSPCVGGDCDYMLALKTWRKIIEQYRQVKKALCPCNL